MSDDTYYTVLGVSETATQLELKTAYRNLLKKIHPDTVSTLSPEMRRTAEDLTKEINEAYSVLSEAGMRCEYDRQLTEYRQQSAPVAPPCRPKAAATSTPPPDVPPPTRLLHPRDVGRAVTWGAIGGKWFHEASQKWRQIWETRSRAHRGPPNTILAGCGSLGSD